MKKNRYFWFSFFIFTVALLCQKTAQANNLNLANVTVASQNTSLSTITLQFDISWENSWRDSVNYDAAWVFVKYSTDAGVTWNHATLKTSGINPVGFGQGSGTGIDILVPSDKKGAFIQRSSQGHGTLTTTSIQIVWDYGASGVSNDAAASQDTIFKIFGVEMVYIPEGGFYAGDGTPGTNGELQWVSGAPGAINSESTNMPFSAVLGTPNSWYYTTDPGGGDDDASGTVFNVTSSFPKGFQAFYLMKYEITEGQWVDFFNTLTPAQKITRDITSATGKNSDATVFRNTISWVSDDATTSRPDRACGYLSWMDVASYSDWAALRPMTELEFEKASRGPLSPVAGEYAWGSVSISEAMTLSGAEDGTETNTTANANANYNSTSFTGGDGGAGPLRAGIFATAATSTRTAAGASYYGVLDLSGNLWERVVTLGNAAGRGFSGSNGDGVLTTTTSYEGNATNLDWPGIDSTISDRGVTGAAGSGFRGGSWATSSAHVQRLSVSNRYKAGTADTTRGNDYGGRCARTAAS